MKANKGTNISRLFKGFRVGKRAHFKLNLKLLEKQNILTDLQHGILELHLGRCTEKNSSPEFIAKLINLLERPVVKAKVDHFGNPLLEIKAREEEKKENDS